MSVSKIKQYIEQNHLSEVKLHLGCGGQNLPGWINIDDYDFQENDTSRSGSAYDIKMDIRDLDVEDESVDAILSVHVVEHFVRWDAIRMFEHWHKKLRVGGLLFTEMPDLDRCIQIYLQGDHAPKIDTPLGKINIGRTQFFGNQWSELDYETHRYVWTLSEFSEVLTHLGFQVVEANHDAKFHVKGRDMFVVAQKVAPISAGA